MLNAYANSENLKRLHKYVETKMDSFIRYLKKEKRKSIRI